MRTRTGQPVRLRDYRPPAYLIDQVDLDIRLDPERTRVRSRLSLRPNEASEAVSGPLFFDGEDLTLLSVAVDGIELTDKAYILGEFGLTLPAAPKRPFTLEIVNTINPSTNTQLMGLYRSNGTYCTQCEAEGFRRITYFIDRPDVLSTYTVRIEAGVGEAPILLANGNPVESGSVASDSGEKAARHYAIWHDPHPKPSYLFAVVGGKLDVLADRFTTVSGRVVDLNIYCEPGKVDRCRYAMDALKRSMRWDEEAFGREYDLDVFNIVAVSDFNMGAMENKGLNIFNDKYVLADPETATDQDFAHVEAVIAHEYFHNWTGNRITCRDWFQLCLKEGLTVFRDQEFSADMRSAAVKRIQDVRALRAQQFPEDAGPLAHPVRPDKYIEINNFYTATVYEKGAEIIRMLRLIIGAEAFKDGMALYFDRHDGDAATVEQFLACFSEASGTDLTDFSTWYSQAGTPEVSVTARHDAASRTLALTFQQTTPPTPDQAEKKPVTIPVSLGLVDGDGMDLPLSTKTDLVDGHTLVLDRPMAMVVLADVPEGAVASVFRGFSAPVRVNFALTDNERLRLASHDSDPFNRWQATQDLANAQLRTAVAALRVGRAPSFSDDLAAAIRATLADPVLEDAFKALVLTLPAEADIAREIRNDIDPDAIHVAREALRRQLGATLKDELSVAYDTLSGQAVADAHSPDAGSAGVRALRNAALGLLAASDDHPDLAERHFEQAITMTDRTAALSLLVNGRDRTAAGRALEAFYRRYEDNALVIDKWFTIQATAPRAETLATVIDLTDHEAFSQNTPNRVRALIGAFALANQKEFNRADGEGFQFVAERVAEIDERNPHVAARLLSAFRSWRALEPGRRRHAKSALETLNRSHGLSTDVRDILDRILGKPGK